MPTSNLKSFDEFLNERVGLKGSKDRSDYEKGFEAFKLGVLIQEARKAQGLTQEEVAQMAGTNKSYISKLEKDLKDIRLSTLQRIIEDGLGGKLEVKIAF